MDFLGIQMISRALKAELGFQNKPEIDLLNISQAMDPESKRHFTKQITVYTIWSTQGKKKLHN